MRVIVDMPTTLLAEIDAVVRMSGPDSEKISRSAWIRAACRRALPVEGTDYRGPEPKRSVPALTPAPPRSPRGGSSPSQEDAGPVRTATPAAHSVTRTCAHPSDKRVNKFGRWFCTGCGEFIM